MAQSSSIVWIDCEMTGLDLSSDELVEIAVIVTDAELIPVDEGLNVVIRASEASVSHMQEVVQKMHSESGLLNDIPHGVGVGEAETRVLEYIRGHLAPGERAPLAGNSIGTDRAFLAKFMPELDSFFTTGTSTFPL